MVTKDPKKIIHMQERHKLAENIKEIRNSTKDSETRRKEISDLLLKKKETEVRNEKQCPFPDHEWYTKIRRKLSPKAQKEMKENISIAKDGVVVMNKMGKMGKRIFELTVSKPNNKDIFEWSHTDKDGKIWVVDTYYFTSMAAEQEATNQWKHFITDDSDGTPQRNLDVLQERLMSFFAFFPWGNFSAQMDNAAKLFWLYIKKSGFVETFEDQRWWRGTASFGCIGLSRTFKDGKAYMLVGNVNSVKMEQCDQNTLCPFFVCEDNSI